MLNRDVPGLQLDLELRPEQVRELIPWDDLSIEDQNYSFSTDQEGDFDSRNLEPKEHEELDLIMRVQDMPKRKLNCPEFPHLNTVEDPNPDKDITFPSRMIATIMKEQPSEEEEKFIEDSKEAMRQIYDTTYILRDLCRAQRSNLIGCRLKVEGKELYQTI